MFQKIFSNLRGSLVLLIITVSTFFWATLLFTITFFRLILPFSWSRRICGRIANGIANNWVSVNNITHRVFCNVRWNVSGLEGLHPKGWYLVVANHQTWVDILVLQKIFNRRIPLLKFFLKKELFWFPIMGQAWWALDFPFMKRYSKKFLEKYPHLKGRDLEITRNACQKFKTIPVSVMNFVEGTRFTPEKKKRQDSPFEHLLRPKAGGVANVLAAMGEHLNSFVDVTIAYPGGAASFWDYLCGRVKEIRILIRSMPITPDMLGDYFEDVQFRERFQAWVNCLWQEKDRCVGQLLKGGPVAPEATWRPIPLFSDPSPFLAAQASSAKFQPEGYRHIPGEAG